MPALERFFDYMVAAFERLGGLEQGRNFDVILDAEQARIVEGGQQGEAGFGLRDQKPYRRFAVDEFDDLGDRHHQPLGGRPFFHQAGEIDVNRPRAVQQIVDRVEVRAAVGGVVGSGFKANLPADRVMQLRGIEPHMNPRQTQTVGAQTRAHHQQILAGRVVRRGG